MGRSRVKGIVIEIGGETQGLDKALEGVSKRSRETQEQLKDVERLLKLDPTNTVLLEQKQRLLAQAAQESKEKLAALNQAQEQAAQGLENYDAWKAAFGPVQAEIEKTKKALAELRAAQRGAERSGEAYTGEYKKLEGDILAADKALRELKARSRELENAGEADTDGYRELREEAARTEAALKDLKAAQREALRSGEAYTADYSRLRQEADAAREKLKALDKQAEEVNREFGHPISGEQFDALQREIAETESALKGLEKQLNHLGPGKIGVIGEVFEQVGGKIDAAGKKITGAGKSLAAVSAAAAGGLTAAAKTAGDLDSAVDRYLARTGDASDGRVTDPPLQAGKESAEQRETVIREIIEEVYVKGYGESAGDVGEALAEVKTRLPELDDTALREATESALAMRDVFGKDVSESIRGVDSLMSQFGISSGEAFNLMVQGAQKGLDQNGDMLDVVNEYAVHFARAGYSAEDMFNMLLSGTDAGVFSVDKLADAVKEFTIRASDGTAADAILENARALGLTQIAAKELAEQVKTGSPEAFRTLLQQLRAVEDETERYQLGVELFGTMFEDLGEEAVYALFDMRQEIDMGAESMDAVKEKNFDNVTDSAENLGRKFMTDIAAPIGDTLIPMLDELMDKIGEALDRFGEMDEQSRKALVSVWLIIAALGPAMLLIGGILTGVGKVIAAIGAIPGAVSVVGAFLAAHPLVLPLAGIFAAAAAIGLCHDAVQDFLDRTLGAMSNQWGGAFDGLYLACSLLTQFLRGTFTGDWEGVWDTLAEKCGGAADRMAEKLAGLGEWIYNFGVWVGELFGGIWDFFVRLGQSGYIPGVSSSSDLYPVLPVVPAAGQSPEGSGSSGSGSSTVLTGTDGQRVLTDVGAGVVQQNVDNSDHSTVNHGDIHVSVYAAPGQSERAVALEVTRQIQWEYERSDAGL